MVALIEIGDLLCLKENMTNHSPSLRMTATFLCSKKLPVVPARGVSEESEEAFNGALGAGLMWLSDEWLIWFRQYLDII